jgi:hypothetical protein
MAGIQRLRELGEAMANAFFLQETTRRQRKIFIRAHFVGFKLYLVRITLLQHLHSTSGLNALEVGPDLNSIS